MRGFSLIEVALALGIIGFSAVSLLGLMPLGLGMFHDDLNRAVCTQVAQRLISESQQTDFGQLVATPQTIRYFDEQGNELSATPSGRAIYQANVSVDVVATSLPGSPSANPNLATVYIQIANNPANKPCTSGAGKRWAATVGVPMCTYVTYVARNQ